MEDAFEPMYAGEWLVKEIREIKALQKILQKNLLIEKLLKKLVVLSQKKAKNFLQSLNLMIIIKLNLCLKNNVR